MLAGQALLGDIGQDRTHDAAQGLLRQKVVADVVIEHFRNQYSGIRKQIRAES
jgi:hypothetical protein